MNQENQQSSYRTGATNPVKSRRGIYAFLLITVILLLGILSVMSILNIHLFRLIWEGSPKEVPFRFSLSEPTTTQPEETVPQPASTGDSVTLELQKTPLSVENIPQEGGLSLQEIYAKTIDAVVSVTCVTRSGTSTGSGVVISENGYLVTNSHVIDGAQSVEVLFNDGATRQATIIGSDALSDLAVLQVAAEGLTAAEFGDDSALRVGDSVVAIGDPLGIELRGTMTNGIISAINRDIQTDGRRMTLIQTNAALNSGNSGGPLLNCYGQVIGINTLKIGDNMDSAGVEGIGFAIPSSTVKEVVDQLIRQGYVSGRPRLGLTLQEISSFDQLYYRIPQGLYITEVEPGSDAAQVGIVPGDILISVDGQRLTTIDALQQLMFRHTAGDPVKLVIYRGGAQYSATVRLDEAA